MPLKNILVAYNGGEASDSALHMGLAMAKKYDAHLTGILAHGPSAITRGMPAWMPQPLRASIEEITSERTDKIGERFHQRATGEIAKDRLHWIDVKVQPDQGVSQYARLFDVTLLGQYENLAAHDEVEWYCQVVRWL